MVDVAKEALWAIDMLYEKLAQQPVNRDGSTKVNLPDMMRINRLKDVLKQQPNKHPVVITRALTGEITIPESKKSEAQHSQGISGNDK